MKPETAKTMTAFADAAIADKSEREEVKAMFTPKPERRDKMLTTRAACELAEVNPKTLFRWERKGYLKPRRITPSRVRWSRNELETFLCETA